MKKKHTSQSKNNLVIIVEGEVDKKVASSFLKAAGIPQDRIKFIVAYGARNIKKTSEKIIRNNINENIAILMDLDTNSNFNAEKVVREKYRLNNFTGAIFTAVPEIEAWLFADIESAKKLARKTKRASELLARMPLPDDIPYPKYLASKVFNLREKFELVDDNWNVNLAISRSPSLKKFIYGVYELLDINNNLSWEKEYVSTSGRDVFAKLVDEVTPPDTIVYKTLDGLQITASEMSKHIQEGTNTGITYSVEVLRIARDLLGREAQKKQ